MTSEAEIEKKIQSKGLNAPRLTPNDIDRVVTQTRYHVFPDTAVTVCCLTLRNGFNVVGTSAAASIENFDKEMGETIAYKNARHQIWQLEGYLLKQAMHEMVSGKVRPYSFDPASDQ